MEAAIMDQQRPGDSSPPKNGSNSSQSIDPAEKADPPLLSFEDKFYQDNPIWTELMKAMHCVIDNHIIFLLDINGYRTYQSLKDFEEKDLKDIELFVTSGDLEERVNQDKLHLYLGPISDPKKFKFVPGEKKLILRVVEYIKKNHKEDDKPLGKNMTIYPLFKKKKQSVDICDVSAKRIITDSSTVVTLDVHAEIVSIRKLIKDYFIKHDFPEEYCKTAATLPLTVKTIERDGIATLSCYFDCPFCTGKTMSGGYRERKSTWLLSNLNRHFQKHKKKEDNPTGTVNRDFFRPIAKSLTSSTAHSRDNRVDLNNSEEEDSDLPGIQESSKQSPLKTRVDLAHTDEESSNQSDIEETSNESSLQSPKTSQKGNKTLFPSLSSDHFKNKYSRLERRKRALGRHTSNQIRITAYFPILNKVEAVIKAQEEMINILKARCEELSLNTSSDGNLDVSNLLKMLMNSAIKNSGRKNHGQRYEDDIKLFSAYLFIVGGRSLYEMLLANLTNVIPSISEVERTLKKNSSPVIEGVFRFQELKDFLVTQDLPMKVSISEGGTRVQQSFSYDPTLNQIVGPVLTLADNGVPISGGFPATSAAMITNHFKSGTPASSAYAIMAQPLQRGAPTFCLTLFGTDNCFTSGHCLKRWNYRVIH